MRFVLLGLTAPIAALTLPAAPAAALDPATTKFTSSTAAGVTVHRGRSVFVDSRDGSWRRDGRHRDWRDRRRHRRGDALVLGGWGWSDEWDSNRSWEHDSYNDWWHERPWRSYPRWVRSNEDCERVWQGGGVWRCSW